MNRFIIMKISSYSTSFKIVKKQESPTSRRGEREPPTVFVSYGVKKYFLDGTTCIILSGVEQKRDTIIVPFTPVKQRRNWINDSVRYLPVIRGVDRLDTVRYNIKKSPKKKHFKTPVQR